MLYFTPHATGLFWVFSPQGEIFLNGGSCRIVQRHLLFRGGVAYGIDCLLAPPSLGGRCDTKTGVDITVSDRRWYQIVTHRRRLPLNGLSDVPVAIECMSSSNVLMWMVVFMIGVHVGQ